MAHLLKKSINALLQFDPKTTYYAKALKDFCLKISFLIPALENHQQKCYLITFCEQGLNTIESCDKIDLSEKGIGAHISATPATFLGLCLHKNIYQAMEQGLNFEGEPECLALLKQWFSDCQIDWAEIVATHLGDPLAHSLESALQKWIPKGRQRLADFCANVGEYAVEEGLITPAPLLDSFLEAVDALRADIERLEAKLE